MIPIKVIINGTIVNTTNNLHGNTYHNIEIR